MNNMYKQGSRKEYRTLFLTGLMIIMGLFMVSFTSAIGLQQSFTDTPDDYYTLNGASTWRGQTFTTTSAYFLQNVSFKLFIFGTPGTGQVSVYATNASGYPTGAILGYGTFNANTITTDGGGEWVNISMNTNVSVSATTKYALVMNDSTADAGNRILLLQDRSAPTYTGGFSVASDTAGVTWLTSGESWDTLFKTWDNSSLGTTITLEYPTNGSTLSDVGSNFTVSGLSGSYNFTNVTYKIWNGTGLQNSTTLSFVPSLTFNKTLFIDNFVLGNYTWNVLACYNNSTFSNCSYATNNFTYNVVPFSELGTVYSQYALEGSSENFSLNLSIISTERLSRVYFVYNGTLSPITPTEYETNKWYIPYLKILPTVSATTNFTFYWSVTLESGLIYNTTAINQTVLNIGIDNCSTYTYELFNLTMKDETSQAILNPTTEDTSIKIDILLRTSTGISIANFSKFYNETNPARVCLANTTGNSTITMDAVIQYSSLGRFVEFYNIQDYILNSTTQSQNISLYNLLTSEGQQYKITYKGEDFVPVSDVIIQVQRKYIDEGLFKVTEIPMSGTNGYTIAHLVSNDVVYNLIFIKNGVIIDTFTDVIATCQNPTFTECVINLNALISGGDVLGYLQDGTFSSNLIFDKTTRIVSSTFAITSGVASQVNLSVNLMDNFGNTSVCSDSLVSAGGTLFCTVPASFGNATVYASISYAGSVKNQGVLSLTESPKVRFGGVLIFSSIIILLFLFGIGVSDNPSISLVFLGLGSILLIGLNLFYSKSLIGTGATILWFIVAIIIILIKGGKR